MPSTSPVGACGPGPSAGDSMASAFPADKDDISSNGAYPASTVSRLVMAEQITHDVVNEAQSMGGPSPIDVNATTSNDSSAGAAPESTAANQVSSDAHATSSISLHDSAPRAKTSPPPDPSGERKATLATDGPEQPEGIEAAPDKLKEPAVNGIAAVQPVSEDLSVQQAAADTSGGSDTDTSRAGKDGTRSAAKKPTSFKSVSVTKNFLAKTAASAPSKAGDKASTSPSLASVQLTAKPRLVAKSGSGVGNTLTRAGLSKLNGAVAGPDPSKVWNKNRPTPPAPPKQFTDEELKQQFGIHMATRLQADDDTKESKWADIDDDEDDWAPETVEWMDGTKSTVKAADNPPPPVEEPRPEVKKEEKPTDEPKPPEQPVSRPSSTGPSSSGGAKTILKPGIYTAGNQTKQGGLVFKGQPDKPTLVAKPSSATPKSPWAALPPVDKISPIVINPQLQQPPARFAQRDPHGFDALPPAPSPAKEIAADDFNRSWREERGPRELFNSQNGRYEPVKDSRRGSVRTDSSLRQPSVLQRPSQTAHSGPAEPSAAFQTSRSSGADEPWARRRTSSNVSGGSGRRMSFSRDGQPMARDRHGSHSTTDMPPPPVPTKGGYPAQRGGFAERGLSPAASNHGSWTQLSSPVAAHVQPVSPIAVASSPVTPDAVNGVAPVFLDPVKIQEQMMREKIERARAEKQRRKEEEEKEEAARKERLRLKLEAMGPPPTAKAKTPPPGTNEPSPALKPATIQSPPKPPVPTAEGEVAQYGMMKVHQPHSVKRPGASTATEKHPSEQTPLLRPSETAREGRSPERRQASPAKSAASDVKKSPADGVAQPDEQSGSSRASSQPSAPLEQRSPAWKSSSASQGAGAVWGSMRRHGGMGGNVWGPPNQERGIGNGTFAVQPQGPSAPGPIAPPPASSKLSTSPSPFTQPPSLEQQPPFSSQSDLRPQQSIAHHSAAMAPSVVVPPGPIAPPKAPRQAFDPSAWTASSIAESDAKLARLREEKYNATRGEPLPAFKETYKQTAMEGSLDHRRVLKTENVVHLHRPATAVKVEGTLQDPTLQNAHTDPPSRSTPTPFTEPYRPVVADDPPALRPIGSEKAQPSPGSAATNTQNSRSSRFFPRPHESHESTQQGSQVGSSFDSPPPPETSSHPVFAGDAEHPVVKLPQKIKVKLPPAASQPSPVTMPARPGFSRLGSQPIVAQPGWQERINGLLGRPSQTALSPPSLSPPKPPATSLAVSSASKAPFDHTGHRDEATVSLPYKQASEKPSSSMSVAAYNCSPVSKTAYEQEVMSIPEAFSSPTICLPKESHMNAGLHPVQGPISRPGSRFYKTPDVFSIDPTFTPLAEAEQNAQGFVITIHMPSSDKVKTRIMPRRRGPGRKTSSYNKKRNVTPRENSNNGARSRRPSGNVPTQGQGAAASSRPVSGAAWGNTGHKTNSPGSAWNRRASGAVH